MDCGAGEGSGWILKKDYAVNYYTWDYYNREYNNLQHNLFQMLQCEFKWYFR